MIKSKYFGVIAIALLLLTAMIMLSKLDYSDNLNENNIYGLCNSDELPVYSMCKDIQDDVSTVLDWNTGTCLLLMPNVFLMFIVTLIISNALLVQVVYGLMQLLLFALIIWYLYKQIFRSSISWGYSMSIVFVSLFIVYAIVVGSYYELTAHFFLPYHMGAFMNALLCVGLCFYCLQEATVPRLLLYLAMNALSIISDNIFIAYFNIPLISALVLLMLFRKEYRSKSYYSILVVSALSVLVGFLLFRLLLLLDFMAVSSTPLALNNIKSSFNMMLEQFSGILLAGGLKTILSVMFLLLVFLHMVVVFIQLRSRNIDKTFLLYCLFSLIFIFFVLVVPCLSGIYFGYFAIRYNIFIVYLAFINAGVFYQYYFLQTKLNWQSVLLPCVLMIALSVFCFIQIRKESPLAFVKETHEYYPALARATDELAEKYHVNSGVANHWDARYVSVFSKRNVAVNTVFGDLSIWHHTNNKRMYFYTANDKKNRRVYDFIVLRLWEDTTSVYNVFPREKIRKVEIQGYKFYIVPSFQFNPKTNAMELLDTTYNQK